VKLPQDVFPTDLHWYPKAIAGKKQSQSDIMVLTATDGKLESQSVSHLLILTVSA